MQFKTCSRNHVNFKPWTGTTDTGVQIDTGVYQLTTDFVIPDELTKTVEDAVEVQAATELGNLRNQFDYGRFHHFVTKANSSKGLMISFQFLIFLDLSQYYPRISNHVPPLRDCE